MISKEDLVWTPNKGLGPIALDTRIDEAVRKYSAYLFAEDVDEIGLVTYILPEVDVRLDVEGEKIVAIRSSTDFYYQNENMIGMTIFQAGSLLGKIADEIGNEVEYDDGDTQVCFEFFDEGLQVWTSQGRIVSATCL